MIREGKHGPFAVATSNQLEGSVTFSLEPTVWKEKEWPEEGMMVCLGELRQKRAGWRAKNGRFWKPSDEQAQQTERSSNMTQSGNEGIQALREIGESQFRQTPNNAVLDAVASCGLIDLDKSVVAYHEAQQKAKDTRGKIRELEGKIVDLREQAKTLEGQSKLLVAQEAEFEAVAPLNATDMIKALFSLVQEVQSAISCTRGYIEGRTGINYYLSFLERFVLPALEGRLTAEWVADDMWATTVDTQITQRISPSWRDEKRGEAPWKDVFAGLKRNLTPERLHILISGVCAGEQIDAEQLKGIIAQLRVKAIAEKWPEEYRS